jgi:hypothetical protein
MSKTKTNPQVQVPKEPTRKQMSRAEREARQRRNVVYAVMAVLAVVGLIVVFGMLREAVIKPNEPVANINGELISTTIFQARVRLARQQLLNQIEFAQQINNTQAAEQATSQLQDPIGLGSQVLGDMIDEVLLRQAGPEFNASVSPEEVQLSIEENFGYLRNPPTPAPTRTPLPTPTPSGPITQTATPTTTPLPTATPITQEGFQQLYREQLTSWQSIGFTEQEYRKFIETRLIGDKVREALVSTVPTVTEQAQFLFIRVDNADVPTFTQALSQDGFDKVYAAILSNTFPISTAFASNSASLDALGFVPRDEISSTEEWGPAIAEALFSTPISQTTALLPNQAGTASFVALIKAREMLPLNLQFLQARQQQAVDDWLNARRRAEFYLTWADRVPTKP